MARRQSRFIVGLFVSLGLLIGTTALVWLGASRYFEAGAYYTTYFDESVQGLQVDSRVKYRGVDIGKVERIGVAPDQKLVEVVLKIDLAGDLQRGIVTQLRAAGITGIVFIELDHMKESHQILRLPAEITPPYPVIPSQPSQTKLILSSADRIMERLDKVDLGGIGEQVQRAVQAIEAFFGNRRLASLIARLDATAGALESSLQRIDAIFAAGRIEGILEEGRQGVGEARAGIAAVQRLAAEARETIAEARSETRGLIAEVRSEVRGLEVRERSERVQRLIEQVDHRTKRVADSIEGTAEEVRLAIDSLRGLSERLRETPSDLIFSRPRTATEGEEEK
jgi:phospholipid/cholesterol/gamma-HCH transport system substrate-binding protein